MMKFSTLVANSSFLTSNSPKISPLLYSNSYVRHNPKHKDCIFANGLLKIPSNSSRFRPVCFNGTKEFSNQDTKFEVDSVKRGDFAEENSNLKVEIGTPKFANLMPVKMSLSDQAFFLLTFVACTTTVAFTSLVIATVPTLYAMARAATSLAKLADTAREELPSTMAAIRLSGMEISDLTLELSDLSQEIADGVTKSTQAVQAAEAGIRQIGSVARQQTMSMIQERANLPVIALQPAVVGAAKKTSQAVGRATKSLMYFISRGEHKNDDDIDKVEL